MYFAAYGLENIQSSAFTVLIIIIPIILFAIILAFADKATEKTETTWVNQRIQEYNDSLQEYNDRGESIRATNAFALSVKKNIKKTIFGYVKKLQNRKNRKKNLKLSVMNCMTNSN